MHRAGNRKAAAVDRALRRLDLVAFDIDLDQRRRSDLFEQETVGIDQEMVVAPRHARRDACVDQIRPSEQIDKAVAGGKAEARLPFRLGYLLKGNFWYRHGRFLHRKSPAVERTRPAGVSSKAFRLTAGGKGVRNPRSLSRGYRLISRDRERRKSIRMRCYAAERDTSV